MTSRFRMPRRAGGLTPVARHRRTRDGLRMVAAAAAMLIAVAAGYGGYRLLSHQSCTGTVNLSVAVAPEIEPAVQATTRQWLATRPAVDGKCVAVEVAAGEPADIAAAIAGRHGTALPGVGNAAGDVRVPTAWVPDSSMWLQRLRATGSDWVPRDAPSIARSPVVLAMPQPAAAGLGWPHRALTWADVLAKLTSGTGLRPGIVDPNRDAAGLSGLAALAAAANAASDGEEATVASLRALAIGRAALRADLLARFPHGADVESLASSLAAAPLSEQTVATFNNGRPPVPLAALYLNPAPTPLDYPYAVLPGADPVQASAARALLVTLAGHTYRNQLAALGLRASDGTTGAGFPTLTGAPAGPQQPITAPDPAVLGKLLATWNTLTAPGRMLTVIDVSGSMATPVPTAAGATRDQVAVEAARRGLALLDDTWAVGLWVFSTQLDGGNDWKQLAPIGPLSSQRQNLQAALSTVQTKTDGGTGLYNTVLAAYRTVQAGWDPSRVNSVVLFTDGKNEDAPGLTLDQLVTELKTIRDPQRPVEVVALGIGDQVSQAELQTITDTTGGGTFLAPDPNQIGEIFLKALSLRPTTTR